MNDMRDFVCSKIRIQVETVLNDAIRNQTWNQVWKHVRVQAMDEVDE
jgi:hypothetical protein